MGGPFDSWVGITGAGIGGSAFIASDVLETGGEVGILNSPWV